MAALKAENERLAAGNANARQTPTGQFAPMEFKRDQLRDRGLAMPIYTLETFFAAMRDGNIGRMRACATVETMAVLQGTSEAELREMAERQMRDFTGYKVTDRSEVSADEVVLLVQMLSVEMSEEVRFRRVNGEWRLEKK